MSQPTMSSVNLRPPYAKSVLTVMMCSILLAKPGRGELLFYEGFPYTVGPDNLTIQGGWSGTGNAGNIENSSLAWSDAAGNALLTSGNHCLLDASGGSSTLSHTRAVNLNAFVDTESPERWISFLGEQESGTAGRFFNVALWAPDNTIRPADSGSALDEVLALGMPSAQPAGQYWRIWDRATGGAGWNSALSSIPTTELSFVVGRIQLNATGVLERFSLWVNPRLDQQPAEEDGIHFVSSDSDFGGWAEITTIRLGAGATSGGQPATDFLLDEVRIGTRYTDVSPYIPAPQVTAQQMTAEGLFLLQWTALPGFADSIEFSNDLGMWTAVQDYPQSRATPETLQFSHAAGSGPGYYRIRRRPL